MRTANKDNRTAVGRWIARNGLSRAEVAQVLGLTESGLSRKASGNRKWSADQAAVLIKWASKRLDRPVSFEELFS